MSDPDLHLKPLSAQSSIGHKTRTPSMKSMTHGGERWQGMFQTVGILTGIVRDKSKNGYSLTNRVNSK